MESRLFLSDQSPPLPPSSRPIIYNHPSLLLLPRYKFFSIFFRSFLPLFPPSVSQFYYISPSLLLLFNLTLLLPPPPPRHCHSYSISQGIKIPNDRGSALYHKKFTRVEQRISRCRKKLCLKGVFLFQKI